MANLWLLSRSFVRAILCRSMKGVHGPGPYFDGPGPWTCPRRGSMDQGSMFCTFPAETAMDSCSIMYEANMYEVESWLIPLINTPLSSLLTTHQHLGWQSVESDRYIWIGRHSANYWPTVDQVSNEYQSGCGSSIEQDVNRGRHTTFDQYRRSYRLITYFLSYVQDN